MSTVTGYRAVLDAAQHLPRFLPMIGTAIGPIKPANVLVVGAGAGRPAGHRHRQALGGVVKAWDIPRGGAHRGAASRQGRRLDVPKELAIAEGGYAKQLPEEWLKKEQGRDPEDHHEFDVIVLEAHRARPPARSRR
jgi:NAD(P) transhydrogenase subunit alpha